MKFLWQSPCICSIVWVTFYLGVSRWVWFWWNALYSCTLYLHYKLWWDWYLWWSCYLLTALMSMFLRENKPNGYTVREHFTKSLFRVVTPSSDVDHGNPGWKWKGWWWASWQHPLCLGSCSVSVAPMHWVSRRETRTSCLGMFPCITHC